MRCRICGAPEVLPAGQVRPYLDYACAVWDCAECGCRFTERDAAVYERLHASASSSYAAHDRLAEEAGRLFDLGDAEGLRRLLCAEAKHRFILDSIEARRDVRKVLEIGCSKGYLTAYLLLRKYDALGSDLSVSAVEAARRRFGDRFAPADSEAVRAGAPYDAVCHAGTIGCVASPIETTRGLLSLLRPGGLLLFNAPNAVASRALGAPWIRGTPPPDLVTLFPPAFWEARFSDAARVSVRAEAADGWTRLRALADRLIGRPALPPPRTLLADAAPPSPRRTRETARRIANLPAVARLLPALPADFGVFVAMEKR